MGKIFFPIQNGNFAANNYAKQITLDNSKSFYFATRLLPPQKQWATFSLYGFCRYVDNLVDVPRSRSKKEILDEVNNLSWELDIAYRTGESQHPVLSSFITFAKKYDIPIIYPKELLNGVIMDLTIDRYNDFQELYKFCYRVAGVVGLMMTHVIGYNNPDAFIYAEKLGVAMQLTNILRDINEDKDINRIYIPVEELQRFNVTESDISKGIFTPQFKELMKFQVNRAWQYYHEAEPGIKLLNRESRFSIQSAFRIYSGILKKIESRDYNPFLGRVYVSQRLKIGIMITEILRSKYKILKEKAGIV